MQNPSPFSTFASAIKHMALAFARVVRKTVHFILKILKGFALCSFLLAVLWMTVLRPSKNIKGTNNTIVVHIDQHVHENDVVDFGPCFTKIMLALREAAKDDRVSTIVLHWNKPHIGLAQNQELMTTVNYLWQNKKTVVFYSRALGRGKQTLAGLALASVCSAAYLEPDAFAIFNGMSMERLYYNKPLRKWGVHPEIFHYKEYKNGPFDFMYDRMPDKEREANQELLKFLQNYLVKVIAANRHVPEERIHALINQGTMSSRDLVEAGLIKEMPYDQVIDKHSKKDEYTKQSLPWTKIADYIDIQHAAAKHAQNDGIIAVVTIDGDIDIGNQNTIFGADTPAMQAVDLLNKIRQNDRIKGVVIRVNSPGGEGSAGRAVYRAVASLRAAGKVVFISMANLAASAGYMVSVAGQKIYAMPLTLTGSIGCYGGKISIGGLLKDFDIQADIVRNGEKSGMFSMYRSFSPEEQQQYKHWLQRMYDDFLTHVLQNRKNITAAQLESIAKGRVWSGYTAHHLGLVDQIGGIIETIEGVKSILQQQNKEQHIRVEIFPKPITIETLLLTWLQGKNYDELFVALKERIVQSIMRSLMSNGAQMLERAVENNAPSIH